MLREEVGELFKAVRKKAGIGVDPNSKMESISYEIADILIFLCAIANRCDVDMEKAFREKEGINNKRSWLKE